MSTVRRPSLRTMAGTGMLALALLTVAATPGPSAAQQHASAGGRAPEAHAVLSVQNHNWLDLHVYLVRDGMVTSLGFMSGPGDQEFTLPDMATIPGADVQFLVLPIGGVRSYLSPTTVVSPGDEVDLVVENNLDLSTVSVFPRS